MGDSERAVKGILPSAVRPKNLQRNYKAIEASSQGSISEFESSMLKKALTQLADSDKAYLFRL